ncbi:DUF7800 domain-containing protein, partial [Streptomyces spiralis]
MPAAPAHRGTGRTIASERRTASSERRAANGEHVPVTGLTPGTSVPYEVLLDGTRVWPVPGSPFP